MRIAVVGSGIAGLASAWLLGKRHSVTLLEAEPRLGGHTHTHHVDEGGRTLAIDSGFIVFNRVNYPLLARLFDHLGVATMPTTMSFSVQVEKSGLEYNATSLAGLFVRPANALSPRFLRMLADIRRFYREAPALLQGSGPGPSLGDWLQQHRYSAGFVEDHLLPMAAALWSAPDAHVLAFPARYLARFMANHRMLQVSGRPQWEVVRGGSSSYIAAMQRSWSVDVRLACPVLGIARDARGVGVRLAAGSERFDHVVLACHADDALRLLDHPTPSERGVLGAIGYQDNDTVLHTDPRLLPRRRRAWAAWNAFVPARAGAACTVSYCMNALQSLPTSTPYVVTLNRSAAIDPARIIARMRYRHPVYTHAAVAAQARRDELHRAAPHTSYAGAYWGFGFHEDGLRSAVDVAERLGVQW